MCVCVCVCVYGCGCGGFTAGGGQSIIAMMTSLMNKNHVNLFSAMDQTLST